MQLGILAAMPEEFREIRRSIRDAQVQSHASREFVSGTMGDTPVVAVLSRIGKVAAATTTTLLIEKFGVGAVVAVGVAGGVHDSTAVGDIVIGTQYIQHDLDTSPTGRFARYEIPLLNRVLIDGDPLLINRVEAAVQQLTAEDATMQAYRDIGLTAPRLHLGIIASGDQFIACPDKVSHLRSGIPGVYCVEMEGASVAQVCYEHNVPFVVVRSISDRADHSAKTDFFSFIDQCAAHVSASIVRLLAEGLSRDR